MLNSVKQKLDLVTDWKNDWFIDWLSDISISYARLLFDIWMMTKNLIDKIQERKPPFKPQKKNPLSLIVEKDCLPMVELPLRVSRHNLYEELFKDF